MPINIDLSKSMPFTVAIAETINGWLVNFESFREDDEWTEHFDNLTDMFESIAYFYTREEAKITFQGLPQGIADACKMGKCPEEGSVANPEAVQEKSYYEAYNEDLMDSLYRSVSDMFKPKET